MLDYIPYTYLIGWSSYNKWYYGVEYGSSSKTANPANLWVSYFTSSKNVERFRLEFGEPDIIQIRRTFLDRHDAVEWEHGVLRRMNVLEDERWLNAGIAGKNFAVNSGDKHHMFGKKRPEHSEAMSGDKNPFYGRKFLGEDNHFFGRTHSSETREKISISQARPWAEKMGEVVANKQRIEHSKRMSENNPFKGKTHSNEALEKMRGRVVTETTRQKLRTNALSVEHISCPYCEKTTDIRNAKRWHFEKCKFSP